MVQLFREARRSLLESGAIPDLAHLNPRWERAVSRGRKIKTTTQDRLVIGAMMERVQRQLEAILLPRLDRVNGFLTWMLIELVRLEMRKQPPPEDFTDAWPA